MKRKITFAIGIIILLTSFLNAQKATKIEIKEDESPADGGTLTATISGEKKIISEIAHNAWIINEGKSIVYSFSERTRGFEGEGGTLMSYDVATAQTRQIMAESVFITGLTEVKLSDKNTALLISMGDGGLGGSYFAVVDPKRGQVFFRQWAELQKVSGDKATLALYKERDWDVINETRKWEENFSVGAFAKPTKVKPRKREIIDLKSILKNKIIYNKTNDEIAEEYKKKYSNLTIYLWRPKDKAQEKEYFLMAVSKEFPKTPTPLRVALESLFAGATAYEIKTGWESAVFGSKFSGVVLKDGIATIKFTPPALKRKLPDFAVRMFREAVEQTAKQFPTVKSVEICAINRANPDPSFSRAFPKCR